MFCSYIQGQWSWVRRVRICAPNVWAMIKGNVDFAHPIFWPYFMHCAPNARLLPPPLMMLICYNRSSSTLSVCYVQSKYPYSSSYDIK